ncbi:MAG: mannose-1-phosphate guanylyltransferase [Marinifilaceae bacterium]
MDKNSMYSGVYCVIMAGGVGNRFWPVSGTRQPKQFLDILNTGKSFIRQSYERVAHLFKPEQIIIVTGEDYKDITRQHIPEIPEENIYVEPCVRNTATCIAYAAYKLQLKDPNAIMVVIPSDHFISDDIAYLANLQTAIDYIKEHHGLLTIGIEPTRVETQYGYIQVKKKDDSHHISKVKTFTEKPSPELAQIFYESNEFLWNAGIFVWRVEDIIKEIEQHMYNVHMLFTSNSKLNEPDEAEFIRTIYGECHNVSVDVGILERSQNVYVLKGDFGWSDMGTWHVFHEQSIQDEHHNSSNSDDVHFQDSSNCIVNIDTPKLVVIQGMDNIIVAEKENYLMICNRNDEEKIKRFEKQFLNKKR